MSSGLASVLESNLNFMKVCTVYSLKILLGNLTWWMVSSSAPKLQVWKLVLKHAYGKLFFSVCEWGALWVVLGFFPKPLQERRENFKDKTGYSW